MLKSINSQRVDQRPIADGIADPVDHLDLRSQALEAPKDVLGLRNDCQRSGLFRANGGCENNPRVAMLNSMSKRRCLLLEERQAEAGVGSHQAIAKVSRLQARTTLCHRTQEQVQGVSGDCGVHHLRLLNLLNSKPHTERLHTKTHLS